MKGDRNRGKRGTGGRDGEVNDRLERKEKRDTIREVGKGGKWNGGEELKGIKGRCD